MFISFAERALAQLFHMELDGCMGGDVVQYTKGSYTRVQPAQEEMRKPTNTSMLHGSPRFGVKVWSHFGPATPMARDFNPRWQELDRHMEVTNTQYRDGFEQYYGKWGCDGEWEI